MKKTHKTHKILAAIVSLVIAVCMWMYVAPDGETELRNLPVTFENEASLEDFSLMLDMDTQPTVSISVYGRRSELISLDREDVTVTVDLGRIQEPGEYQLDYTVELPASRTSSMAVSEYITTSVTVTVVQRASKTIDVKGVWNGELAEGNYLAEQLTVDPEQITIFGPEELVNTIDYAQVLLERTNLEKTVTEDLEYTLVNIDGEPVYSEKITSDVQTIKTTQPVVMTKEVPLAVTLISGGGATADNAEVTISPASSITISGDQTTLDGVSSINLGSIDLGEIQTSGEYTFTILIPNDTKNISEISEATVTVTLKGLETAKFRVSKDSFEVINAPEDYDCTFLNQYLQVEVRGSSETIAALQTNNIRVVADLASATSVGQCEVPVTIYIDGYTDVGAFGTYTVYVTVSEPEEGEADTTAVSTDTSEQTVLASTESEAETEDETQTD